MSEPANRTRPWQRYLSNGPPPSPPIRRLPVRRSQELVTDRVHSVSSQSSTDSASQSAIDLDHPDLGLNWTPNVVCAKGTTDRYWIVENSKRCSDFCKDQLKVIHSIFVANARTCQRDFCGPLRPRNPRQHGLNSTKLFIVYNSLPMSFADGAEGIFNIPTALLTKAHRQ